MLLAGFKIATTAQVVGMEGHQPYTVAIVDMSGDIPTTNRTGDMQESRTRSSFSLLADGSVTYTGGHDLKHWQFRNPWNSAMLHPIQIPELGAS